MLDKYNKFLSEAPENKTFKTANSELTTLKDLRTNLIAKGKPFFSEYVNSESNHFANWIENVFEDHMLANALRNTSQYGQTMKILDDRINYLELWVNFNKPKEMFTNQLASMHEKLMNTEQFSPSHHAFETVGQFNANNMIPKSTIVDEIVQKKELLKASVPVPVPEITNPEMQQAPAFHFPEPEQKKGFFSRFFKRT